MKKIPQGFYGQARYNLAQFLGKVNRDDLEWVLDDICTPQEIIEIYERVAILEKLKQKSPQRSIAEQLGVSVTTVNRGSRILQFGSGVVEKYL